MEQKMEQKLNSMEHNINEKLSSLENIILGTEECMLNFIKKC